MTSHYEARKQREHKARTTSRFGLCTEPRCPYAEYRDGKCCAHQGVPAAEKPKKGRPAGLRPSPPPSQTKVCGGCGKLLALAMFAKCAMVKGNTQARCRDCRERVVTP